MITLAPWDAYRMLAEEYGHTPNPVLALERRTLPGLLPPVARKVVVDVAAGTGYWAAWCSRRGAFAVAADWCWEMLEQSPRPAVLADALRLPFRSSSADVAICSFGLGYAPACLPELARITRPGGVVIASDLHPAAIERGWTRSFRHRGQVLAVEHQRYTLEELATPGLSMERLLEPAFGAPERAIFEQAGKLEHFDAATAHRAIFAALWRRT